MRDDRWVFYGAASGAISVALFATGFLIAPQPPDFDAPAREVVSYFDDERTRIQVASAFAAASVPFFVWFLATVYSLTRPGGTGTRRAGAVAYGCGVIAATLFLADTTAQVVAALRPENMAAAPELAVALKDFSYLALGMGSLVFAGVFAAFAVIVLRDRALWPDWLGWAALVTALVTALRLGSIFTNDGLFAADGALGFYIPVIAFLLWLLIGSMVLAGEVRRAPDSSGLFGGVSSLLGRVRETLPGGGSG